jgi:hypothetical protein
VIGDDMLVATVAVADLRANQAILRDSGRPQALGGYAQMSVCKGQPNVGQTVVQFLGGSAVS